MKKNLIITTIAVFSILTFTGCTKTEVNINDDTNVENTIDDVKEEPIKDEAQNTIIKPTEQEIRDMIEIADTKIYDIVDVTKLDSNYVEIDGRTFSKSTIFKEKEDIVDYLKDYLTEETIEEVIEYFTMEKDNILYIGYGQRGIAPSFQEDILTFNIENDILTSELTKMVDNELIIKHPYNFKFMDGKWLLINYK